MSSVTVTSHLHFVVDKVDKAAEKALTMIGGSAEGHAKEACPVDTGLLRNSITYALGGQKTSVQNYSAKAGGEGSGHYEGSAPADDEHSKTVYVGTNVQYAPFVELGHRQQPGRFVPAIKKRLKNAHVAAKPFIRPAMEKHQEEYAQIILKCFKEID